ncbi:MAG: S-layer homology domain-containing protein, partial [Oscillospiraceae bacterium]|nr:S-layer homology domain-containing protein [Oscillospiraceae bacterium]
YSNGIYRFYQASTDAHKSGTIQVGPKNIAVRHGYQLALEVLIPEPGVYTMEMWPAINDAIVPINVYMAKGKVSNEDADKIGSYDSKDMSVAYNPGYFNNISKTPYFIENIVVEEPGYYVFNFVGDASMYAGEKDYNYRRGSVGNFSLYSGTDKSLMGGFYSENEDEVMYMSAYPDESEVVYTDPVAKGMTMFNVPIKKLDGTEVETEYDSFELISSEPDIATIGDGGIINTIGDGAFEIDAKVVLNGKTYKGTVPMSAYDDTGVAKSELVLPSDVYVRETLDTTLVAIMASGNRAAVPTSVKTDYSYEPEGVVKIDENGKIVGLAPGTATVTASAFYKGAEVKASADIICVLHEGKTEPTYYTYKKRDIALENISKYSWARSTKNSAVSSAEKYLENYEFLYNHIPHEGIPRSTYAANAADPDYKYCRYCGEDIAGAAMGGVGGWVIDPIRKAWKIQCPHCKRTFPSNDFGLLYERGLDENGFYDADRARANNAIAVENGEKDALLNTDYTEIANIKTINNGRGLRPGETVEGWGVDDGWGYRPKDENGVNYKVSTGSDIEIHAYIPYYMTNLWGTYDAAITTLADAYLYTGDIKYGRAGAILFDRYADLIHEYDTQIQQKKDGDKLSITANGFIKNGLSDAMNFGPVVKATDALYPAISDPQVVSFLSKKAVELGLENDKTSPEKIWDNWKGFYLEIFDGAQNGRLNSNFGVTQGLIATCAVVLNEEPETTEMIKWVYAPGNQNAAQVTGGNVLAQLINDVDRDGMGNESADNYNVIWYNNLWGIADALKDYNGEVQMNLLEYPKFPKMFTPYASKVLASTQLAQVGDSSGVARLTFNGSTENYLNAFKSLKDNPKTEDIARIIAQYIYVREGYTLKNLKYGIFVKDPESVQDELMEYIDTTPDQISEMIAGYGFAILRDGGDWRSVSDATAVNNQRDVWMYFGAASSHSHNDNMVIGLEAFGLNIAPDNGYPERTGKDPNRAQWHNPTIAHNTVTVNEKDSIKDTEANGVPLHFDDNGQVKLMDVDGKCSYEEVENYRRTLVMIKVDDDISYTVDFFRVTGGDKHTYSFHSQAEHAIPVDGIELTEQKDEEGNWIGTYAYGPDKDGNIVEGVNVPYQVSKKWEDENGNPYIFNEMGADPYTVDAWSYNTYFPRGYTWLTKIRRDKTPEQNFAIEFDVEDYRKAVRNTGDIRLRMTQLNSFAPSEVAIVAGLVPRKEENKAFPETFDYVLVHNSKKNDEMLDSLYTTVFEPYKDNRYIETIEAASVEGIDASDPTVRAVKVTHTDGERVDYIVYSADNTKTLRVDNTFEFQGFIGIYSLNKAGEVIYKYVNDGAYIGELRTERAAYEGVVTDFDGEMNFGDFDNYIDVSITDEEITDALLSDLAGKWMFVKNDGKENAAYKILSAEKLSNETIRLNTGNVTNIRSYVDAYNPDLGYIYNIGVGDRFRIPVSESDDASPVFNPVRNITTNAGGAVSITIHAESPLEGKTITYFEGTFPRGMTINQESGEITWNPSSSQVGENHISVTAKDSDGRESTIHFNVTVYGSTTGGTTKPTTPETPSKPSDGDAPAPSTPSDGKTDVGTDLPGGPSKGDSKTENVRFVDLGAHAWAADSINALADAGIIKGTSENTFSPASNITRADFALLLVRAFELESDNTENFADVADSDYFAKELAIARNTGIVNGIGDNKYAPRNTITRQDMMTIVYRALGSLKVELKTGDVEYADFADVSEYAKEAVSSLIGAGFVNGKNGKIAPTDYTTRAEVAVLIKRILDYTKA